MGDNQTSTFRRIVRAYRWLVTIGHKKPGAKWPAYADIKISAVANRIKLSCADVAQCVDEYGYRLTIIDRTPANICDWILFEDGE